MKNFLISLTIFLGLTNLSLAVETKYCPQELEVNIPKVETFSKSFSYNIANKLDSADFDAIDYILQGNLKKISLKFKLTSTSNSNCLYQTENFNLNPSEATISGTDNSFVLKINYYIDNVSYRIFIDPSQKRPEYGFSGSMAQIKAYGSYRDWDETIVKYIPVAKGSVN